MAKTIIYTNSSRFTKHYLIDLFDNAVEVSEQEFFDIVGYDRSIVPMKYEPNNVNRQNFFLNDFLIGYRTR